MSNHPERIEAYRAKAVELRQFAAAAATEELRLSILEIAERWDVLAEQLESARAAGD